jgi:hypothetical protein
MGSDNALGARKENLQACPQGCWPNLPHPTTLLSPQTGKGANVPRVPSPAPAPHPSLPATPSFSSLPILTFSFTQKNNEMRVLNWND